MTIEDKRKTLKKICESAITCGTCAIHLLKGKEYCFDSDDWIESIYNKLCENNTTDAVNHPAHYQGAHECIEIMEAMFGREAVKNFCRCNAFKYRYRADKKNGAEDIKKAEWYEDYLIKMEQEDAK